jgi:hypothetical protein
MPSVRNVFSGGDQPTDSMECITCAASSANPFRHSELPPPRLCAGNAVNDPKSRAIVVYEGQWCAP